MKNIISIIARLLSTVFAKAIIMVLIICGVMFYGAGGTARLNDSDSLWSKLYYGESVEADDVKSGAGDIFSSLKSTARSMWGYVDELADSTSAASAEKAQEFAQGEFDDEVLFDSEIFFSVDGYEVDSSELGDKAAGVAANIINNAREAAKDIAENVGDVAGELTENLPITETSEDFDEYIAAVRGTGLNVYIFNVGQASSALFECNGEYMLFDGGDRETSSYVYSCIKNMDIEHIKYVIASHYDSDHIAGLIGIVQNMDIDCVVCPDYVAGTKIEKIFKESVAERCIPVCYAYDGMTFPLGNAQISVVCPMTDTYQNENSYSVGVRILHGYDSILICGDASGESEREMLDNNVLVDSDVYIVNHHGSSSDNTNSAEWINAVSPMFSIISCGLDNEYGHPHDEVIERLTVCGSKIYRTDVNGEIFIHSTGTDVKVVSKK